MVRYITVVEGLGIMVAMLLLLPIFCILWLTAAVGALCGDRCLLGWCTDTIEDLWVRVLLLIF